MKPRRTKPGPSPVNISVVVINNDASQPPKPLTAAIRETAAGCLELVPLARRAVTTVPPEGRAA
jgi:hypothetical protein